MASTKTKLVSNCSFCEGDESNRDWLFAGRGVYICSECVDTATEILEFNAAPDKEPDPEGVAAGRAHAEARAAAEHAPDGLTARIRILERTRAQVDEQIAACVLELRAADVSWSQIGKALDVTKQAAWERYAHLMPSTEL